MFSQQCFPPGALVWLFLGRRTAEILFVNSFFFLGFASGMLKFEFGDLNSSNRHVETSELIEPYAHSHCAGRNMAVASLRFQALLPLELGPVTSQDGHLKKNKKKQMKTTFSPESKKTTPIEIDSAVFF